MAYTKRTKITRRKGSRYKVGSRAKSIVRKAGAYGPYRSTRFVPLRSTARLYAPQRISKSLSPFPNTKFVRHKYVDSITFPGGIGAGSPASYQFRANSMFDPDYSGVGHQPMFRDEMAAQYQYYTVVSSYIKVTFPAEDGGKRTFALWIDDDGTVPTSQNQLCEQHRYYPEVVLNRRNTPFKMTARFNAPKWNKTNLAGLMANTDFKTAVGSNPSSTATKWYNIMCWPSYLSDTLVISSMMVEMFFVTAWREPIEHPLS